MGMRMALVALGLAMASTTQVGAQSYPAKTITFVVPNLPGGSSDLIARAIGAKLQETMGRPVVIDNKPGASEMIATEFLARAAPDGYTIAIFSNALAINEHALAHAPLRHPARPCSGGQAGGAADGAHRERGGAGHVAAGVRVLRQGKPGQAQLRPCRRRRAALPHHGVVQARRRNRCPPGALQELAAGLCRAARR